MDINKVYKKYLAIDQFGNQHFIRDHPRKWLLNLHGVKSAKVIRRGDEGIPVGWIVAGHWYEVLRIVPLKTKE